MPALTFDDLVEQAPSGGVATIPAQDGRPTRVVMNMGTAPQKSSGPLTFDDLMPESGLDKAGRYAEDFVRSTVSGIDKGVAGLAGLPADLGGLAVNAGNYLQSKYEGRPYSEVAGEFDKDFPNVRPTLKEYGGETLHEGSPLAYTPQTGVGQAAENVAAFLPGGMIGRTANLTRNLVAYGLVPGLVSEGAGQLTKGTALEAPARFAGALAGGIGGAVAARPSAAVRTLAGQMPSGVTPQMVDQAGALMAQAKQSGIDLTWPEALSQVAQRPVMTDMLRHLEASPQTAARMGEYFARRPQQVDRAVRGELDNIAAPNYAPSTIGPAVGTAAEGAVNDVRGMINKAAEPFYDKASTVLLGPAEMQQVRALPGFKEARDAVRKDPQLNRYVSHLPDNSVGFLNEVKKELDRSAKNAVGPLNAQPNMQRAAGLGNDATSVKNAGINASGRVAGPNSVNNYEAALGIEQQAREKYLKPLLQGPLGKLADKDITTKDAINALFPKTPLANSEDEISTAVSALSKRNPKVASDLVRAHLEGAFNNAAKDLQPGANQAGGAKFRVQIMGDAQQRINLRAAIEALPNGADRWRGFNKIMDVMEAIGSRQGIGSKTAYNEQFLKEIGVGRIPEDAAKIVANPARFLQPIADRYERWKLGKNLDQIADIVTDPKSANLLRELANTPARSAKAVFLVSRLAIYNSALRRPQETH